MDLIFIFTYLNPRARRSGSFDGLALWNGLRPFLPASRAEQQTVRLSASPLLSQVGRTADTPSALYFRCGLVN